MTDEFCIGRTLDTINGSILRRRNQYIVILQSLEEKSKMIDEIYKAYKSIEEAMNSKAFREEDGRNIDLVTAHCSIENFLRKIEKELP